MSLKLNGISASNGVVIARAYKLVKLPKKIDRALITDSKAEILKLNEAIRLSENDLMKIKTQTEEKLGLEEALIFEAQIQMLKDPDVYNDVIKLIIENKFSASFSYQTVMEKLVNTFVNIDNPFLKSKASDINDILNRVINHLNEQQTSITINSDHPIVLVANDLVPTETVNLDRSLLAGIVTAYGSKTSHTAILAKSLNIPAVVGLSLLAHIKNNDLLIIDGREAVVIVNPSQEELDYYEEKMLNEKHHRELLSKYRTELSKTKDGHLIPLLANINGPEELDVAKLEGSDGIGLFRTEFLYMKESHLPSLEDQYEAYSEVLNTYRDKEVVIRTFDIGGDKNLVYLPIENELNPFLGYRALRLSLTEKNIFIIQIEALLKANKHGNLKILLPMVSTIDELIQAKTIIKNVEDDLINSGFTVMPYKIGIMIEVPAAALALNTLIDEIDFVSIGTNDLIQYMFAADRLNERVSYLYQPFHPVVLNLIKYIVEIAHKNNKIVSVCGEMAGHVRTSMLLLGIGVDQLSMHPHMITSIRKILSEVTFEELKSWSNDAIKMKSNDEVKNMITNKISKYQNR